MPAGDEAGKKKSPKKAAKKGAKKPGAKRAPSPPSSPTKPAKKPASPKKAAKKAPASPTKKKAATKAAKKAAPKKAKEVVEELNVDADDAAAAQGEFREPGAAADGGSSPEVSPKGGVGLISPKGSAKSPRSRSKRKVKTEAELSRELFNLIDVDLGGEIDAEEMERFIRIVDPLCPATMVHEILTEADTTKRGSIAFDEFNGICAAGYLGEIPSILLEKYKAGLLRVEARGGWDKYLRSLPKPEDVPEAAARAALDDRIAEFLRRTVDPVVLFRELFDLCDEGGEGELSHAQMQSMIRYIMPKASGALVDAVIETSDKDGNGDIDFDEFQIAIEEGSFGKTPEELLPLFQRAIKKVRKEKTLGTFGDAGAGAGDSSPEAARSDGGASPSPSNSPQSEDARNKAKEEVKNLQKLASEKRQKSQQNKEEMTRQRLRRRLVDFYARHNPEKVREEEIARVVDVAVERNIDEDTLFRQLYKKYHLDESGEPVKEGEETDSDESTEEEVDESQLTEQELEARKARREAREAKRLAKKQEEMHKAVQEQIKRENRKERQAAIEAKTRFLSEWKSEDERKRLAEEERLAKENAAAEAAIRRNEDAAARGVNRKNWIEQLLNAKDALYDQKCDKLDQKRAAKKRAQDVHTARQELKGSRKSLDAEYNVQTALSQNIRVMETILASQAERIKEQDLERYEKEAAELRKESADLQSRIKELHAGRLEVTHMLVANRQYNHTLHAITESLRGELLERKEVIRTMREGCLDELKQLRAGSHLDLLQLEQSLDGSLASLQADLKRREEQRMQDGHTRVSRERGIHEKMLQYQAQCNSEIAILKERLLDLYPAIIMDKTSSMGKHVHPTDVAEMSVEPCPAPGSPAALALSPRRLRTPSRSAGSPQQQRSSAAASAAAAAAAAPSDEHVVLSLDLWKPRGVYVRSGYHTKHEFFGVVQLDEEVVFDRQPLEHQMSVLGGGASGVLGGMVGDVATPSSTSGRSNNRAQDSRRLSQQIVTHGSLPSVSAAVPLSPCEILPSQLFDAMKDGKVAARWRTKLGLCEEDDTSSLSSITLDEQQDRLLHFDIGTKRRWEVITERGARIELTVDVRPPEGGTSAGGGGGGDEPPYSPPSGASGSPVRGGGGSRRSTGGAASVVGGASSPGFGGVSSPGGRVGSPRAPKPEPPPPPPPPPPSVM